MLILLQKIRKIRSSTVEPVLGTLINFTSMKRVNTRGIKQATKHVLMAALCYNLKKYMKFQGRKAQITAQSLSNHKNEPFQALFEAIRGFWSDVIFMITNTHPKFTWAGIAYY